MPAGKLTERVFFDRSVSAPDGYGGQQTEWVADFDCAAGYTRMRGGETVLAGRLTGTNTTIIRVRVSRSSREVTPDWRIRDRRTDEVFNIRSIIVTDDRLYLDMTCESGVAV